MSEIEELRRNKLEEIKKNQQTQQEDIHKLQKQLENLEAGVKPFFTPDALQRYGNLKIAHHELAINALIAVSQLLQMGKIKTVDDVTLKKLLLQLQGKKREINIRRK